MYLNLRLTKKQLSAISKLIDKEIQSNSNQIKSWLDFSGGIEIDEIIILRKKLEFWYEIERNLRNSNQ